MAGSFPYGCMTLGSGIAGFPSAPSATETAQVADLGLALDDAVAELNALIETEVPKLNKIFTELGLKTFPSIAAVAI